MFPICETKQRFLRWGELEERGYPDEKELWSQANFTIAGPRIYLVSDSTTPMLKWNVNPNPARSETPTSVFLLWGSLSTKINLRAIAALKSDITEKIHVINQEESTTLHLTVP